MQDNIIAARRLGKFGISRRMLEKDNGKIFSMLPRVLIVRAEMLYYNDIIEYVAYCESFDSVIEGNEIPTYSIIIDSDAKTARFENG